MPGVRPGGGGGRVWHASLAFVRLTCLSAALINESEKITKSEGKKIMTYYDEIWMKSSCLHQLGGGVFIKNYISLFLMKRDE